MWDEKILQISREQSFDKCWKVINAGYNTQYVLIFGNHKRYNKKLGEVTSFRGDKKWQMY